MTTQATRFSVAHKVLAAFMSIVLVLGLSPMLPIARSSAYANDKLAAASLSTAAVEIANGEYKVSGLESSLGMFHFVADSVTATIAGDTATLSITVEEPNMIKRYDGMAYDAARTVLEVADGSRAGTLKDGARLAEVTDIKDDAGNITARTFKLPVDKSVLLAGGHIPYTLKYTDDYTDSEGAKSEYAGKWYAGSQDYQFESGYQVWTTNIAVDKKMSMFNVDGAMLSSDGEWVCVTMGSDSFGKVALSKARKADDEPNYEITNKQVVLPVSELGEGERITTSWWSVNREDWYERDLTFDAQALTLVFDVTVNLVDAIDKLGTIEEVEAAIANKTLDVTPELVDDMIGAIQVQVRDDKTDFYCAAAKALWDALSAEEQNEVDEADYFALDTGDASKDDPLNADEIGDNEILVVSFGTSFNDSRVETIGAVEKAIQAAFPDWSVRRAFTAQIIINHIQARDGEEIDNMDQALERAVANGVKNLIVAPTHLMHGAEYDELVEALAPYQSKMAISVSEPLLGAKSSSATEINADKEVVAKAVVAAAAKDAGFTNAAAAAKANTAFVFMGHGTSHEANVTYNQMQAQMDKLGYANVFIGTVEGEPEDTECSVVIDKVKAAGYKNVILRPLMVVAGDHANNDMADPEDEESWYSQFKASGAFSNIDCQIQGLGAIPTVQQLYVSHVAACVPGHTIAVPTAVKGLKYTGATKTGVKTGTGYTLSGNTSAKNAGSYTATAKLASGYVWADGTNTDKSIKWSIAKASATAKATASKSFKAKNLKKKVASFTAIKLTTDGKAAWKVVKNSNKKAISFKAGKVTVNKGTAKGKYTLQVKASAKAGTNYAKLAAKTYKITVTVK